MEKMKSKATKKIARYFNYNANHTHTQNRFNNGSAVDLERRRKKIMCFLCHPLPDIKVIPQDILCKHQLVGEKEKEKTLLYDRKAMRQAIGNW